MRKVCVLVVVAMFLPSFAIGQDIVYFVYEMTMKGKKCTTSEKQQIDCEYRVGKDFWLTISGIGMPDTAITFMSSSFEGDFYGTVGVMHGCVIVKPGKIVLDLAAKNGVDPGFAFISPKNGKVYRTWQECEAGY